MKTIAVLITCYNRSEMTLRCLKCLFLQALPSDVKLDVFLVDDGSTDETGAQVKKQFPQVHVIQGTGVLYWAGGMRLAWKTAAKTADYDAYLWLNDDVYLADDVIVGVLRDDEWVQTYEKKHGIIVGTFADEENGRVLSYGGFKNGRGGIVMPAEHKPVQFDGGMSGNFVFVPNEVFKKIGMFSEKLIHALGDFDYAFLAHKAGVPTYCASGVTGWCSGHSYDPWDGFHKLTFLQRVAMVRHPTKVAFHDFLVMALRYSGFIAAVSCWLRTWMKVFCPFLIVKVRSWRAKRTSV
jgi:Predicted glycosyltransferases